jgi:hypothetical protein
MGKTRFLVGNWVTNYKVPSIIHLLTDCKANSMADLSTILRQTHVQS